MEWLRKLWVRAKVISDVYRVLKSHYEIVALILFYVGVKWEWVWNLVKNLVDQVKGKDWTHMQFPVNWVDGVFALGASLITLKALLGRRRGLAPIDSQETREPIAAPSRASSNEPKRISSTMAPVLYILRDKARSDLVDRQIQNDAEMERWEKDVRQWFADIDRVVKELFLPEDLAYLEEQESTRKGWFLRYRYSPYNERHENLRNKLWHYTEVLKDIVDKYN